MKMGDEYTGLDTNTRGVVHEYVGRCTRIRGALDTNTQGVALCYWIRPFRALTLSRSHTLTLSRSHTLTLSHSHTLTLSHSHTLTLYNLPSSHSFSVKISSCSIRDRSSATACRSRKFRPMIWRV